MGRAFFLVLLSVVVANHTQYYESYCYNTSMALPTGTSALVGCWRGPAIMTRIWVNRLPSDNQGDGNVNQVSQAECCPIESGGVPPIWSADSQVATGSLFDNLVPTDEKCPTGYFLSRILMDPPSGATANKTTKWLTFYCLRPRNLDATYKGAAFTVDFVVSTAGPRLNACPDGSFIVGFRTKLQVQIIGLFQVAGDLSDIATMYCAYPQDATCAAPPSNALVNFNSPYCRGANMIHQYCVAIQTCSAGYYASLIFGGNVTWKARRRFYNVSAAASGNNDPRLYGYEDEDNVTDAMLNNGNFLATYSFQSANNKNGWIKLDLGLPRRIIGVLTIGSCFDPFYMACVGSYVRKMMLGFSNSSDTGFNLQPTPSDNVDTNIVTQLVNVTAQYVFLNITDSVGRPMLRMDVQVQPEGFFMIKEASFGFECSASNINNRIALITAACQTSRLSCTFSTNISGIVGNASCIANPILILDWFYNGVLQPGLRLRAANFTPTFTLVPSIPARLTCEPTTTYSGQTIRCDNMNECLRPCDPGEVASIAECYSCRNNSNCSDTPGSFTCPCNPGYSANRSSDSCENVNECKTQCNPGESNPLGQGCNDCNVVSTHCQDSNGSFSCPCNAGYEPIPGVANQCAQINECIVNCTDDNSTYCNRCFPSGTCTDLDTGYSCLCPAGYDGDGFTCTDIDECQGGKRTGYMPKNGDGGDNQGGQNNPDICPENSNCFNTNGSYYCECVGGYQFGAGNKSCVDIDECAVNPTICGAGSCLNTVGGYLCPPYISLVTWQLAGGQPASGNANLTSVNQNPADTVTITVMSTDGFLILNPFAYGSIEFPLDFQTALCSVVSSGNQTNYTCFMGPGAGQNLRFALRYSITDLNSYTTVQSNLSKFSYPPPSLASSSLGLFGNSSSVTSRLNLTSQFGNVVMMNGSNLNNLTNQIKVTFAGSISCTPRLDLTKSDFLVCEMNYYASGVFVPFQVTVGRGSSAQVVTGTDMVRVVLGASNASCVSFPTILAVTGNFSTEGGRLVMTTDISLTAPVTAFVGDFLSTTVPATGNSTNFVFPSGTGKTVLVVGHGTPAIFSLGFTISYSPPVIVSITSPSCNQVGNLVLSNCTWGQTLTISINGANFGASGATVLAGGIYYNATHAQATPHQQLVVCIFATGAGAQSLKVFSQANDGSAAVATYQAAVCQPGFISQADGTCALCAPGSVSNTTGQTRCSACSAGFYQSFWGRQNCTACDAGSYSIGGNALCLPCSPGTYVNTSQATACLACAPGSSASSGAANCSACNPGTFQPLIGMGLCTDCPAGTYSNVSGATFCAACSPGYVSVFNASVGCQACQPGRFQAGLGGSTCALCNPGTYVADAAAQWCLQCAAGMYANASGAVQCTSCNPGTSQGLCGKAACDVCGTGRYAANQGQVQCDLCMSGSATNQTGQTNCRACSAGTAQPDLGASACLLCAHGTFSIQGAIECQNCPAGKSSTPNQEGCMLCPIGTYNPVEGSACANCAPGTYQTGEGQTTCTACPAGSFSSSPAICQSCAIGTYSPGLATNCSVCNPGSYSEPKQGATACVLCTAGYAAGQYGATGCVECIAGKYSKEAGTACIDCAPGTFSQNVSGACERCPSGSYPAGYAVCRLCSEGTISADQSICLCPAGEYTAQTIVDGLKQFFCRTNPVGTVTDLPDVLESDLVTLPGYWRSSNATLNYYRCLTPQYCLGGKDSLCGNFREGPMCALCKPGYKSAGTNRDCALCPENTGTSWAITLVILLVVAIALIAVYTLVLKMADFQQQELLAKEQVRLEATIAKLNAATTVGDEYFEELRAEIQDKELETAEETQEVDFEITAGQRRDPNFMYKIKIFVGFYQVASLLPNQGGINWPRQFVDFIQFFSFLNFDFIPWQNLACAVTINYYTRILVVGLLPVALIAALALFFGTVLVYYGRTDNLATQVAKQTRVLRIKRQFTKLVLFTAFLLYPFVSRTSLGVYNCVEVDGVSYVVAEFSLLCGTPEWTVAAGYSALFVALYPLGTPIIYYILMSRADRRSPDAFLELGFLYEAYNDNRWYWELADMGHKLFLTSIVVFMPNELIMGANMVVMVGYLIMLLVFNPYLRKGDDRLHLLAQVNLFVLALMGHALRLLQDPFKSPFASRNTVEILLSALLIAINVIFLGSFLIIAGRNVKKAYVRYATRKKLLPDSDFSNNSNTSNNSSKSNHITLVGLKN